MNADDPRHASGRGYRKHRRDGEDPCQPCKTAAYRDQLAREAARPVALTGGRWVAHGGIQVWRPDVEEISPTARPLRLMMLDGPTIADTAGQIVAMLNARLGESA